MKHKYLVKEVTNQNAVVCLWEDGTEVVIEFYKTFEIALAYATKLNKHYAQKRSV